MEITPKKLKPRSDPNIDKIQKERSDANRAAENATITRDMVRQEEIKYIDIIREALRCDELRRNQLMCEELYTERPLGVSTLINAEAFPKQLYTERPLGVSTLINAEAFPKQLYTERPSPKGGDLDKELMCEDLIYKPIRREP